MKALMVVEQTWFNVHFWSREASAAAKKGRAAERIRAMLMTQYGVTADIVHGTPSGHELFQANLHFGRAVVEECLRHGEKLLTGLLQHGIRDGEFELRRSSLHAADIARLIISFAQNSLLDRHHTPPSSRKRLRKTLNFILDS